MRDLLDPASAVAVGICLAARLRGDIGRQPVTERHPHGGCGWEDYSRADLVALLDGFDSEGPAARTFSGLRRDRQEAMVREAQAIPEPLQPVEEPAEPGWFDLPGEAAS